MKNYTFDLATEEDAKKKAREKRRKRREERTKGMKKGNGMKGRKREKLKDKKNRGGVLVL